MPQTIAVDFDGVLHKYSKKWHDGSIYDEPIPGAREAMQELLDKDCEIVIYSTRCSDRILRSENQKNQIEDMKTWLEKHSIPYTKIHSEAGKPLCKLFIDDNAYRFTGNWDQALNDVKEILKIKG